MTDRSAIHAAIDTLLDALDAYRRAPPEEDLVRVRDLPFEAKATSALIRSGRLRVVKIGRNTFTRRSYLASLVDELPAVVPGDKEEIDDVGAAARKRAERLARPR